MEFKVPQNWTVQAYEEILAEKERSSIRMANLVKEFKFNNLTYEEYKTLPKYIELKEEIEQLAAIAHAGRKRLIERGIIKRNKYDAFEQAGERLAGMTKLQKAMASLSGQKLKFKKIEKEIYEANKKKREEIEIIEDLDGLFRK